SGQEKLDFFLPNSRFSNGGLTGLFQQFFFRLFKAVLSQPQIVEKEIEIPCQRTLRFKGASNGGGGGDDRFMIEDPRASLEHSTPSQSHDDHLDRRDHEGGEYPEDDHRSR